MPLGAHDFSGKATIPLITHGGYGLGDSLTVMARYTPRAQLAGGFSLQAPQERQSVEQVTEWLDGLTVARRFRGAFDCSATAWQVSASIERI